MRRQFITGMSGLAPSNKTDFGNKYLTTSTGPVRYSDVAQIEWVMELKPVIKTCPEGIYTGHISKGYFSTLAFLFTGASNNAKGTPGWIKTQPNNIFPNDQNGNFSRNAEAWTSKYIISYRSVIQQPMPKANLKQAKNWWKKNRRT